jgi:hypothetical protein
VNLEDQYADAIVGRISQLAPFGERNTRNQKKNDVVTICEPIRNQPGSSISEDASLGRLYQ